MSKKTKLVATVVIVLIVVGFGIYFTVYSIRRYQNETNETIAKLEQEIALANEKAEQVATKAEDTKKKLKQANTQIEGLQEKNKELEEAAAEATETPTVIPETTVAVTPITQEQADDSDIGGKVVPEASTPTNDSFIGNWGDEWSKRAGMDIYYEGGKLKLDVRWASSASEGTVWKFVSDTGFSPETSTIEYYGSRYIWNSDTGADNLIQQSSDEAGVFTFDGNRLCWTNYRDSWCNQCVFVKYS